MTFAHSMSKLSLTCCSSLLYLSTTTAAPLIQFASPMGDEKWRMTGNPIRCGLSLVIPNFGIGYFEQYATKQPHFILRKWEEVLGPIPANVVARPPIWKPGRPSFLVTKSFIKPGAYGVFLNREPTLKLLAYLSQGYQATVDYRSAEGFNITVIMTPIRFQKVYSKYQQCLGGLLSFNYSDVKETTFHFEIDSKELTEADQAQLKKIATYAAADGEVEVIKVYGYADESGRKGYNNAVSQFRAESVSKYLLKLGVPKKKIYVTWFGALKPIGRNDTEDGRAANRRVVVKLLKK